MNSIVSLPISAAVPVASPSIAGPLMPDASSVEAQLARLEQAVNVLRTRHVCQGWTVDEAGAERALAYFRKGCPDDDEEWTSALYFIASHGLSPNWIISGDPSVMIAEGASMSRRATATDPIFSAIQEHGRAYAALSVDIVKTDDFEAVIPASRRKTRHIDEEVFETDDPRWLSHLRTLHELHEAESDAECALASIVPTTKAGVCALLKYGAEVEERGCAWPELCENENDKWGRSWYYFVNRNIVECLEGSAA